MRTALRLHDLRHAYATLLIEAGADLYEVSRGLGNSSIATAANGSAHLTDAMRQRVAEAPRASARVAVSCSD